MRGLDRIAQKVASSVIGRFGKKTAIVLIQKPATGAYNRTTGAAAQASTSVPITGTVWTASKGERAGVEAGDYRVLVASLPLGTVVPSTEDQLSIDGDVLQIVDVETIWASDEAASYILTGRD